MTHLEVEELIALLLKGKTYINGNPSAGSEERLFWNGDRNHFEWWTRYPNIPMADDPVFYSELDLRSVLVNAGSLAFFKENLY